MDQSAYDDIPGTTLFDAAKSREGYHLNMFCMSLMEAANRAAFKADEEAYLDKFPMSKAQREAVRKRDWNEMLRLAETSITPRSSAPATGCRSRTWRR